MDALTVSFALLLYLAVLLSRLAKRTVLSTAVLFLAAGLLLGSAGVGLVPLPPGRDAARILAELALFVVLLTDGAQAGLADLRHVWSLPGRALLFGMPLTAGLTAALAHALVGLGWRHSLLLGVVLAPTDPVFASAVVGRARLPEGLRRLLNVESGLNDGLALPGVLVLLATLRGTPPHALQLVAGLLGGVAIGVVVISVAVRVTRLVPVHAAGVYRHLDVVAWAGIVYAVCRLTHANVFLAAFSAGVTTATIDPTPKSVCGGRASRCPSC